ncbi:Aste57867_24046 [Aphanomyces stellatus]|uniref:Aste57867_24046 protein n=1 Tax=Aphanomyces stellatus TaxID=120398 RepID=A0A485LQ45_9STRA|nr:hypothetical protein As57867_023973 [Aphanomyces stellatus]VFU00689.1 Aste57867_24046 [Aphanomyces stellatus]
MSSSPKKPTSKLTLQRWYFLGGIVFLMALAAFVNVSFFMSNSSSLASYSPPHFRADHHAVAATDRYVKHVAFTATCSERDIMRATVLAFSAREQQFKGDLTYVAYKCDAVTFAALHTKLPAHYNITFFHATGIQGTGDKELDPHALHAWIAATAPAIAPEEFVMVVEVDTIFTRTLDLAAMLKVADTMPNPYMMAQDAAWFDGDNPSYIMPLDVLEKTMGKSSKSWNVDYWRGNAVHAPFVLQARHLAPVFAMTKDIHSKLDKKYQHLAYPLACAELELEHGVSGNLRLSRYNSFAENWNVVDMIKYNPINETISPAHELYGDFPFTMRTHILQLTAWKDGAEYLMRDLWVPLDFFHCDAALLQTPPPSLWTAASTTYGWEFLSSILRTRHIVSIMLTFRAYNGAALDIKQHTCPDGFNNRRNLLLAEDRTSAFAAALPLSGGDLVSETPDEPFDFVVVSTCSNADQWQMDMLAQSFNRVAQPGSLTRIVTGCQTKAQVDEVLRRAATANHVRVHFAPASLTFQPHALRHWLQNSNLPHAASRVVVLALDFLFLRRFQVTTTMPVISAYPHPMEDPDMANFDIVHGRRIPKEMFFYSGDKKITSVDVAPGTVVAQNVHDYVADWTKRDQIAALCPDCPMGVAPKTSSEAYDLGLPYVLTAADLRTMIDDACTMTYQVAAAQSSSPPPTRAVAEAIGFSIAAAKHGLTTVRLDNLALTQSMSEDWHFALAKKEINAFTIEYLLQNPCADDDDATTPTNAAPFLRHVKRFEAGPWMVDVALVPENVFACDMWLFKEPPAALWDDVVQTNDAARIKNVYGVCTTLKLWNALLVQTKRATCPQGFNAHKRLQLVDPRPDTVVQSLAQPRGWTAA